MKAYVLQELGGRIIKIFGSVESAINYLTCDGKSKSILSDEHSTVYGKDVVNVYHSGMILVRTTRIYMPILGIDKKEEERFILSDYEFIQ